MLPKILFVDDDPLMHQLYRPHVERAGYGWIGTNNGREALKVAAFAGNVPLQAVPLLHHGLTVCCALGKDGCGPLADVAVRVISFEVGSSDAFAFRQRAAIYRAVRRCFFKSLAENT